MSSGRNRHIVAYDISEPKRWRKVFKKMHGFGDPIQYSVFRCDLSPKERAIMVAALDELIHHDEDRVMIVDMGPAEGRAEDCIQFLGKPTRPPEQGAVVV